MREGFIEVEGGRVWYRIVGASRPGIPLLALHGGPGGPHDYLEPLEALQCERPVIFYDQLGCGNSDRPEDLSLWTVERFVEELATVRRALGLEQVHILGQSWGSMLAMEYMLTRRPSGVLSLILCGPCLSVSRFHHDTRAYLVQMPTETQRAVESAEASGDFASETYQEAIMQFYRRYVCRLDPWPDCMQRTMMKMGLAVYGTMWGPSEFTLTGILKDFERAERLGEIQVPALFTCGRWDEATPETTAYYQSQMPGSEMVILEDASHMHHLEQTEQFLGIVRDFLARVEGQVLN